MQTKKKSVLFLRSLQTRIHMRRIYHKSRISTMNYNGRFRAKKCIDHRVLSECLEEGKKGS